MRYVNFMCARIYRIYRVEKTHPSVVNRPQHKQKADSLVVSPNNNRFIQANQYKNS